MVRAQQESHLVYLGRIFMAASIPFLIGAVSRDHRRNISGGRITAMRAWDFEIIEQPGNIVGQVFISNIAVDVGCTPVALHLDGDHYPRF